MKTVMFVCMANICRSPALMAALNHIASVRKIDAHADSSGIGWVHSGQRPSLKTFEAAKKRGILINHTAQQFQDTFFEVYDYVLGVNHEIVEQLKLRGPKHAHKIGLVSDFSFKYKGIPIPDPYYLSDNGFDEVLDMIIDCCEGLLVHLLNQSVKEGE